MTSSTAKRQMIRVISLITGLLMVISSCSDIEESKIRDMSAEDAARAHETAAETDAHPKKYTDVLDAVENGENEIRLLLGEILSAAAKWPAEFHIPDIASSLTATGPYPVYSIIEKKCVSDKLIYLVFIGDTIVGTVTVRLEKGTIECEYSADLSKELNQLEDLSAIFFAETMGGMCAVCGSGEIIPLRGPLEVFSDIGGYGLSDTVKPAISEYVFQISPEPGNSLSVPEVSQYEGDDCYLCFLGCIAALVRAREPDKYHSLTVAAVSDDIYDKLRPLGGHYTSYLSECASNTWHIIENVYLDQGPLYHLCADFDGSMSLSEYRETINKGGIVICAAFGKSALHSVVMCGCADRTYGGIFAAVMDPLTGSHHLISWSDGRFSFNFSSVTVYMGEYVLSYY